MRMKCNVGVGCGRSENCILCKIARFLSTRTTKGLYSGVESPEE